MCGRSHPTFRFVMSRRRGPGSGSAPCSNAEPMRCAVAPGGDAKCQTRRLRNPHTASEHHPLCVGRLWRITSTARTDDERTSDTRSGCRWPVERDSGTTIISNFDDHLALGAHHQPELRERQSFEVRTFGAASGASRELVRWKRHGIKHRRLEAIRNLVGRVDDRRARHGCRRSGRRFRRVAGSARHHGQNACHQRDHSHTSTDRSDVSRPLLAATELVPTSYPTGRTPAISSGMPAHCLAPAPVASLSFDHCEYAAPDRGRSAARVGPESQ